MAKRQRGVIELAVAKANKNIPKMALASLLGKKLRQAGLRRYREMADHLAEHILSGRETTFQWDKYAPNREITLHFSDEDAAELERISARFVDKIPDVVNATIRAAANMMVGRIKSGWRESRYLEQREFRQFADNLENSWGAGLDLLRMLLAAARDVGERMWEQVATENAFDGQDRPVALVRLHHRACQVASEIICLLENGYPDGALARWRTLHELASVSTLLADGDEELSRRYLDHDAVEQKRALDRFLIDYVDLGDRRPAKRLIDHVYRRYDKMIGRYGKPYGTEYGWAASYLEMTRPRFIDIQKAAGRASMHSHYKHASYTVHASARSLHVKIGSVDDNDPPHSGATNAGLDDPGRGMAVSLSIITSHLYMSERLNLDEITEIKAILELRDEAISTLARDGRALRNQEIDIRKAIREYERQLT